MALACGASIPQAAKQAGIGVSTGYRRVAEAGFREKVARARDDILGRAIGALIDAGVEAVAALRDQLGSEDEGLRHRAANAILEHMVSGYGLTEVIRRLEALEATR
jgi:hypothetical protein